MSETIEAPAGLPSEAQVEVGANAGAIETPNNESPAGEQEQPPAAQPEKTPAWLQRKIDKMTFERRESERQAQTAREEMENLRRALAAARGEQQEEPQLTPDQIRQEERQRFEQQQAEQQSVQKFASQTEVIAKSLAGAHGEDAVGQATQLLSERAGLDFGNKSHRELIADISELPNSGDVYYALAHDPDTAGTILDASPRRQYALLTQFAAKVGKPAPAAQAQTPAAPAVSKAPPPVSAPSGAAATGKKSIYDPNVSPAEFDRLWKAGVRS
ncbi:hypothetical protein [Gluconobacter roseus]|uniref:Scaffolding protein n=1 Tax=Gluconobacter roseus NBRC 3990 TaxID=1307950 RepID=A0A4Y3M3R6_9PROT|nr:hypothetical protein [Gluconobacter roseus]KXV43067.1 hypothetical protein AD943_08755 [Gluconobacter roseus]GBR43351.1 hypothetical protein AA3990_0397 [Gluconobacter roseus NBRC 3990]GEB03930.1 hypothetical protein GRO01_15060 [Gluconobacter roseus NBRC 3990]GLP94383.1 hypothetical protein GCM10007871_23610 [Gluconobacter roseus NBRC 3990]